MPIFLDEQGLATEATQAVRARRRADLLRETNTLPTFDVLPEFVNSALTLAYRPGRGQVVVLDHIAAAKKSLTR